MYMKKLEFNIVVIKKKSTEQIAEENKLLNLGLEITPGEEEETLKKYSFMPDRVVEVRESFIMYDKGYKPCVTCMYYSGRFLCETPPLLIAYDEFMKQLEEYYESDQKNTKT